MRLTVGEKRNNNKIEASQHFEFNQVLHFKIVMKNINNWIYFYLNVTVFKNSKISYLYGI